MKNTIRSKQRWAISWRRIRTCIPAFFDQKDQETQDTLERLKKLTGDLNDAIKQETTIGVSKGEMAIRQMVQDNVVKDEKGGELVARLVDCISKVVFPGWQKQTSVARTIKRDIILELAKFSQENPDVNISPDDFSTFSQEAMKYVEKHF